MIYYYCDCNYYYFSFISYRHCKDWNRQKECKIKLMHKILVKIVLLDNSLMNVYISLLVKVFWMVYFWSWQENESTPPKEAGFSCTFRNLRIHAKQFFLKVHPCSTKFFLFFQAHPCSYKFFLFFQVHPCSFKFFLFFQVQHCSFKFFLFFQVLVILPSSSLFFQVPLVLWITHFSPASS